MKRIPEAGQLAPEFSLPDQDGTSVSLKAYRGKWVVLYFYPKDNTPGCSLEARHFQRDLPKYKNARAVVLGVSLDSEESHRKFCAREHLTFHLLTDTKKEVSSLYGSLRNILGFKIAARNTFLIDPEGRIAKVWIGVKPATHSQEILAELTR